MSLHYEVVISCFLKNQTPELILDTLRWLCGLGTNPPKGDHGASPSAETSGLDEIPDDDEGFPYQTLRPDPDSYLAGGDVARLQRQVRGFNHAGEIIEWGFYARTFMLDDGMGEIYRILELIAPYVSDDGYGGHEREEDDTDQLSVYLFSGGTVTIR